MRMELVKDSIMTLFVSEIWHYIHAWNIIECGREME